MSLNRTVIVSVLRPRSRRRAPLCASAMAHSRPMPRDAPVMSAVRPASSLLRAVVLDIVVDRLPEHEARQLRRPQRGLEHTPERHDDVFRRGNTILEEIDFEIEVAVIHFA